MNLPFKKLQGAALVAAMLILPRGAFAERITEADLLNGVLPSTMLTVSATGSSAYGTQSGSAGAVLDASDTRSVQFDLSKESCGIDFYAAGSSYFNTYAVRVARSSQYYTTARAPKKWQIWGKGSGDDAEWELLSTEENQTGWQFADNGGDPSVYAVTNSPGETRYYHFNCNRRKYTWYRFSFLESNGDSNYIAVTRIILYNSATPWTGATAETFAGCEDLVPSDADDSRYTSTTHAANNNTVFTVGRIRTAFSDEDPARVMMKNVADGRANLIYEFGTDDKKVVNGYMVRFASHENSDNSRAPYAWTFSGSDDKENWTTLDTRDEQLLWSKDEKRYYRFENHKAYAYYKIEFTANNGQTQDAYYYEFGNLDYYYLPVEDVYFTDLSAEVVNGELVMSGALADDSLSAAVSYEMTTNGIPFVIDCGTVQPGESFAASFPVAQGTVCGKLVGVSGSHTNTVAAGPFYIPGEGAAILVSPDGDDENDGLTLETPMRHIAAAVEALGADGGTVYVMPGSYAETNEASAVTLAKAVSVIGVTGDPSDVVVTKTATFARIFRLDNASALLRALTICGGDVQNEPKEGYTMAEANTPANSSHGNAVPGGNIWITANGGLVENCIISNGVVRRYGKAGGNVYMEGGRVSRCLLSGGSLWGSHGANNECGTSLEAEGGVVESCLFTGTSIRLVPICVGGSSKLVNCTVTGNSGDICGGVMIKGNNSRVVNTVVFGNTTTNLAAGAAVYCASQVAKEIPTSAAAAFVNCATDGAAVNETCKVVDATAFADYAGGDLAPASKESPLVNAGADYSDNGGVSPLDLRGNARQWPRRADIGAYEFIYTLLKGFGLYIR